MKRLRPTLRRRLTNSLFQPSSFVLRRSALSLAAGLACFHLAGCSSSKPVPPKPARVEAVQRTAAQAAQLSENQHWPAAAREWQAALERYQVLNDRTNAAIALHNLAQAQRELGQFSEARDRLLQAANLNETLRQTNEWWSNQLVLLQLDAQTGNTNALRDRFATLFSHTNSLPNRTLQALWLNELGLWRLRQGEWDQATAAFRQARDLFTALPDELGLATVLANEARLLEARENHPAALAAWRAALAKFESLAHPRGIAESLLGQGRTLLKTRRDLSAAEDLLRRAARNYRLLTAPADQAEALRLLIQCLDAEGQTQEAQAAREELRALAPVPRLLKE